MQIVMINTVGSLLGRKSLLSEAHDCLMFASIVYDAFNGLRSFKRSANSRKSWEKTQKVSERLAKTSRNMFESRWSGSKEVKLETRGTAAPSSMAHRLASSVSADLETVFVRLCKAADDTQSIRTAIKAP